ncbi:MAG: hypothetical protein AB7G93_13475 [Bdellovibrionales bacterium]
MSGVKSDVKRGDDPGCSSAAECLLSRKKDILAVWEERTRKVIAPAKYVHHSILIDSLPVFLDELVESLRRGPHEVLASEEELTAREHGKQRTNLTEYSLE